MLLRQQPLPAGPDEPLAVEEYDRVNTLFDETMRRQVEPRVATLEALLHPLAELGCALTAPAEAAAPPLPPRPGLLRVVTVADLMADLAREVLIQLLLQLTLADVRAAGEPPVLVLVGADAVAARHLEALAESARNRGGRVVYLFGHLRGDTAELLGDADSVYLMRLGNGVEAAKAAEFIGREYRFVLHQRSASHGSQSGSARTVGRSTGLSQGASTSLGGGGNSTTVSDQRSVGESRNIGTSTRRTTADQRVYEVAIEPVVLQQLSDTAFVVVRANTADARRARFGDCDPRIAVDPARAPQPTRRAAG